MDEQDKTQDTGAGNASTVPESKSLHNSYSKLPRDISEEDLKNPAIGRMLLSEIDRCTEEVDNLSEFKDKYYAADSERSVLRERLENINNSIGAREAFLTFGALLGGFLPSLWNTIYFWPSGFIASTLLLIGIFKKGRV